MSIKTTNVGAAVVTTSGSKTCHHFCKYFRCKYGDKCTFVHPQRIKDLLAEDIIKPRPGGEQKRGICHNFAEDKNCRYGDRKDVSEKKQNLGIKDTWLSTNATQNSQIHLNTENNNTIGAGDTTCRFITLNINMCDVFKDRSCCVWVLCINDTWYSSEIKRLYEIVIYAWSLVLKE